MSAVTLKSRTGTPKHLRAFTLIEILVVVGIIILLIAILVPSLYHAKLSGKIASTRSTLSSIRTGLASYYSDFSSYPDSHPTNITSGTYGTAPPSIIPPGRGPALLAQALMGYLPGSLDGAGPDSGPNTAAYASDPHFGFRTRGLVTVGGTPTAMGKIYGPYAPDSPAAYKINDTNPPTDPTQHHDQSFYDSFGNEILFFLARPSSTNPIVIFNTSNGPPNPPVAPFPIFYSDDCSVAPPNSSANTPVPVAPTVTNTSSSPNTFDAFFPLIAGTKNSGTADLITSYPGPILGRDSYLLISAGLDGQYFTADDIVMADH